MSRRWLGGLKTRLGLERYIGRGEARYTRLNSENIQAGEIRRTIHSVGGCGTSRRNRNAARRTAPEVRAV